MVVSYRATARLRTTARPRKFPAISKALPRRNHMWLSLFKSYGSPIELRLVQELRLKDPMRSLLELRLQPRKFRLSAKVLLRPNRKRLSFIELRLVQELRLEDPMRSLLRSTAPTWRAFRLAAKELPRRNHMWLSLLKLRLSF